MKGRSMKNLSLLPLVFLAGCLYKNDPVAEQQALKPTTPRFTAEPGSYIEFDFLEDSIPAQFTQGVLNATYSVGFEGGWVRGHIGDLKIESESDTLNDEVILQKGIHLVVVPEAEVTVEASVFWVYQDGSQWSGTYKPATVNLEQPNMRYTKFQLLGSRCLAAYIAGESGEYLADPVLLLGVLSANEYQQTNVTLEWCEQQALG